MRATFSRNSIRTVASCSALALSLSALFAPQAVATVIGLNPDGTYGVTTPEGQSPSVPEKPSAEPENDDAAVQAKIAPPDATLSLDMPEDDVSKTLSENEATPSQNGGLDKTATLEEMTAAAFKTMGEVTSRSEIKTGNETPPESEAADTAIDETKIATVPSAPEPISGATSQAEIVPVSVDIFAFPRYAHTPNTETQSAGIIAFGQTALNKTSSLSPSATENVLEPATSDFASEAKTTPISIELFDAARTTQAADLSAAAVARVSRIDAPLTANPLTAMTAIARSDFPPSANLGTSVMKYIQDAADKYDTLDVGLITSVIKAESNFDLVAVSPKGAMGLMQLMPRTAESYGVTNAFDPEQNIAAGTAELDRLIRLYDNLALALAAYNAGQTAVDKHDGIPPYEETRTYVVKILTDTLADRSVGVVNKTRKPQDAEEKPEDTKSTHSRPMTVYQFD